MKGKQGSLADDVAAHNPISWRVGQAYTAFAILGVLSYNYEPTGVVIEDPDDRQEEEDELAA